MSKIFIVIILSLCTIIQVFGKCVLTDEELLNLTQKQTFRYFWDYAHPVSGLARERSNRTPETVTIGGSGFGVMALIVGIERCFITREQGAERLLTMVDFLQNKATRYHGMWAHWINGTTGKTIPFSPKDNGADIVESSFMFEGLLTARQYFNRNNDVETRIRVIIDTLWNEAEWTWFTQGRNVLYWHWSPNYGFEMNHEIRGYNECLITYILAAAAPKYSINADVYHQGWARSGDMVNGKSYYGIELPLGSEYGGPLFFSHYSYLGLDPRGLKDKYADYENQVKAHTLINRQYCIENPKGYPGYGSQCWGLTASDGNNGYSAHAPMNDKGVITPTAALSSVPYTPEYSIDALRYFYEVQGNNLWGEYGFRDAFNPGENWYADSYLAIDQGPVIVMIENYRSRLLWNLFMSHPDVSAGLKKLGFVSPYFE